MDIIILFFTTLVQVSAIAMQNIQIIRGNMIFASLCASVVGLGNVFMVTIIQDGKFGAIAAYILANALGVPLAMYLAKRKAIQKNILNNDKEDDNIS